MNRSLCAVALVAALSGCGLIDSDITDVDLSLPPKEFTVDTAQWELQVDGDMFPAVDCSEQAGVCSAAAMGVCPGGSAVCFARCENMDVCHATVLVKLFTEVDLETERPELAKIDDKALVEVTIQEIWYDVLENSMNIDSPPLTVYVAPMGVMSGGSPQALEIGVIPAVAAGQQVDGGQLQISEDGQEALKMFLADFRTPFNLIVEAVVEIQPGDPMPMGMIRAEFNARATAGL